MYIDQLMKTPIKKHSFRQNQSESCAFSNEMSRDTLRIVPYFVLSHLRFTPVGAKHVPPAHSTLPHIRIS